MGIPPRPPYRSLPVVAGAPPHSAWGLYGPKDDRGALNLLTPERAAAAARLVRAGQSYRLDLPLDEPSPPLFGREPLRHDVFRLHPAVLDDRLDNFFPQGSTQWDALSHFGSSHGFYDGCTESDIRAGRLSIDAMGERGIVGRAVLADVAGRWAERGTPIDPESNTTITPGMLKDVLAAQGTTLEVGDILLVRTGWLGWYLGLDATERAQISDRSRALVDLRMPGLGPPAEIAELLWDSGVAAVATDTPMVEVYPPSEDGDASGPGDATVETHGLDDQSLTVDASLHAQVLALLGIPLGEFFVLDELAEACRRDGRFEMLFTSAPLRIRGGIGSPPNAIALR